MKLVIAALLLLLTGCAPAPVATPSAPPTTLPPTTPPTSEPTRMPDLTGLTGRAVSRARGALEAKPGVVVGLEVGPTATGCDVRPGTVVRQWPAPGSPVGGRVKIRIQVAVLDLHEHRGPCRGRDLGPLGGRDAALARSFYEFAADPGRGAPFVPGAVWVGVEAGPADVWLDAQERRRPEAWRLDVAYAERGAPQLPLDIVTGSGGWYEVHAGIVPTCPSGHDEPPPALAGLRAITLSVDPAVADSCLDTWGVTLFLDADDRIAGVALRIGSP